MPTLAEEAVVSRSLGEEIVDSLQREIIAGVYRPGQRLPERELIRRFQVSSIPVREALQELENRGLVVRRYNCGCSVVQLSAKEVERICELRRTLETQVVQWAAERVTDEAAKALKKQLSRLEWAAAKRDLAAFFQEDLRFHRMIWEAGDNAYATKALETVLGSLFASGMIGASPIDLRGEAAKHRRLLTAICEHDAQRAALALLEIASGFEKHLP